MRRFYREVNVISTPDGWSVTLDNRPIQTPAKSPLSLPSRALAQAIAAEWDAQSQLIEPAKMPLMQIAATAIDHTRLNRAKVVQEVVAYISTDLVCYRANQPADLAARQEEIWQPLVDWLRTRYDVALEPTSSIMAVAQPSRSVQVLERAIEAADDFALTATALLVGVSGSLVIGLAIAEGQIDADRACEAALLDENYQSAKWGLDPEAEKRREDIRTDIAAGARFLELLQRVE